MDLFIHSLNNVDSAYYYANKARTTSLSIGDSLNFVRAEYALGHLFRIQSRYNEAIVHYKTALRSSRINGFKEREQKSLNDLALSYYNLSKFDYALRYHLESLKLREEEGDPIAISIATNNIGLVYYQLNDYEKALIYFQRTKQIDEDEGLETVYGTYVNIGLTYTGLGETNLALDYFTNVIEQCDQDCDALVTVEAYNGRSDCRITLGEYEKALQDLQKALLLAKENDLKTKIVSIYHGYSLSFFKLRKLRQAQTYADSSLTVAKNIASPRGVADALNLLAKIANHEKEFDKAYKYQVMYDSVSNEILNEVIAKNLLQVQVDFEERENLEIIELQNKEINRRTTLLALAIVISILTALVVILLYKNNTARKRVNRRLRKANDTIEDQNKELVNLNSELEERVKERTEELRASNAALIKSNHELDNFIYKTSHDIRGPLATLQGICNIALMDIKDAMSVDYFQKLSKTASKLNRILSKLLIVNQINNSSPNQEEFNLGQLIVDIVDENKIGYIQKEIKVLINGEERLSILSDEELIKIIVSNIVNNAFKFHDPAEKITSIIEISYSLINNELLIEVIDNGLGINESVADQIFDIFSKTSEMQDSAGMGLYLVKLAVDKLEGNIQVLKSAQGYTRFYITIPLL